MFSGRYATEVARALQRDCIKDGKIIIKRVFFDNILREGTKTGAKGVRIFEITPYMREVFTSMSERRVESPFVFIGKDVKHYTSKNLNATWHEVEEKSPSAT